MDGNSEVRKCDVFDDGEKEDASLPVAEELVVALPIEDSLDLHTFSPREIKPLVEEYLYQCQQREFREVRIIHGRGTGTQRNIVRSLLARNSCVAEFKDAPPESGGWGATVVRLKPRNLSKDLSANED
jgi:DNA-nicking Smr family endonuclease